MENGSFENDQSGSEVMEFLQFRTAQINILSSERAQKKGFVESVGEFTSKTESVTGPYDSLVTPTRSND